MSKLNEEDIHPHAQRHTCPNVFRLLGLVTLIYIFYEHVSRFLIDPKAITC